MWLMDSEIPVRLEILDQAGRRLHDVMARLKHIDETYAVMALEEPISTARLHWGAPVRFELEDGLRRYEITGAIIARQEEERSPGDTAGADAPAASPTWEVRLRIWECSLNVQRRAQPRRKLKFAVKCQTVSVDDGLGCVPDERTEVMSAVCIDIGPGGIRIRTKRLATVPDRMHLEFCLPVSDGTCGVEAAHAFCLVGRVIRSEPHGRHGDSMELALNFERISVRDGMVLRNLLS